MITFPIVPSGSTICVGHWGAGWQRALPLIARALNHANVSTTAIYARLDLVR
jgi:hypothetical protein